MSFGTIGVSCLCFSANLWTSSLAKVLKPTKATSMYMNCAIAAIANTGRAPIADTGTDTVTTGVHDDA